MTITPQWLDLLKSICDINSATEDGAAGTTEVSTVLGHELEQMGFELSWHEPWASEGKRGKHLIATRNTQADRHLILIGHSDTVLPAQSVPFKVDHAAGRLYGSGVCDMKGGDVLMLFAIRQALATSASVNDLGLVVTINCAEENASPSFPALVLPWAKKAIACLCFEPARPGAGKQQHFVTARKGSVRFNLTCHGKASHAGNSHQMGVSAIRELARKIEAIELLTDYSRDVTANVGMVQGGRVVNQIAAFAQANFELRAFDPQTLAELGEKAREICTGSTLSCPADGQPTRLEIEEVPGFPAWRTSSADEQLAGRYIQIAKSHGLDVAGVSSGGGSDASHLSGLTPIIDGLGILGGSMHNTDEWADMSTFETRMHIARDLIIQLAEKK